MSQLVKQMGDICISCTVVPVLGITLITLGIYHLLQLFF